MDKINVLQGQGDAYDIILPHLIDKGISIVKQEVIPLTQLHNKDYWRSLVNENISLARLDQNHWFYPDDVFEEYAKKLSHVPLPAICMFEDPFRYEQLLPDFDEKFVTRTKVLADAIRSRQKTVLISPPIQMTDPETQEKFLNYLVRNRSLFDVYGVHCCMYATDHSMGFLTGFVHQALTTLLKPVWVTKWAIPTREYTLEGRVVQGGTPTHNYVLGARNLRTMYLCIDDISPQTKWFFSGACVDEFHPEKLVDKWQDEHFLGLIEPAGELKGEVLKALLDIHTSYN